MNDKRQVTQGEAELMAKEKDLLFQEVSAKSGVNVNNLFYKDIFDQIARKYNLGGMGEIEENKKELSQRSKLNFLLNLNSIFR